VEPPGGIIRLADITPSTKDFLPSSVPLASDVILCIHSKTNLPLCLQLHIHIHRHRHTSHFPTSLPPLLVSSLQPPAMTSPSSPQNPLRPSKFIEGSPLTPPDLLRRPTALNNILAEMDVYEQKRKHRGSSSSIESLDSTLRAPIVGKSEKHRSFGRLSLGELDRRDIRTEKDVRSTSTSTSTSTLRIKVKGRLRALTGGN